MDEENIPNEVTNTISYPDEVYEMPVDSEFVDPEITQVYPGLTGIDQPGEMTDDLPQVEESTEDTTVQPEVVEIPNLETNLVSSDASADMSTADGIIAAISDLSGEEREALKSKLVTLEDLEAVMENIVQMIPTSPELIIKTLAIGDTQRVKSAWFDKTYAQPALRLTDYAGNVYAVNLTAVNISSSSVS